LHNECLNDKKLIPAPVQFEDKKCGFTQDSGFPLSRE